MLTSVQQSLCHSGAHFQEGVIHLFGVSVVHVHPGLVTAGREMGLGKIFPRCDLNIPVVTAAYKEESSWSVGHLGAASFSTAVGRPKLGMDLGYPVTRS